MKNTIIYFIITSIVSPLFSQPSGKEILNLIDKNLAAGTRIMTAKMIISGARGSRTIEFKTWAEGEERAFTEYTNPPREKGTKMLKLEDKLWIFSPSTDRIIQITGQMLRQSVMGSDLSYEDMMEDPDLTSHYNASVIASDTVQGRDCWVLQLNAAGEGEAYEVRKIWVDRERFVPLREELFGKSGKLLKRTQLSEVTRIQGRWYPMKIVFKDMLKAGDGTQFIIETLRLDDPVPENIFSKASLK
ncbi:MAG: outer membrane lipoprotein-sorting protein [Bacteroidales bacterium]|nr:outer membrane lipoprotein-sorting protein [Bacteroidales bacterium]